MVTVFYTRRILRPSPPEDQAGVTHAISPIWMKLGQIKGKCVGFAAFPLGVRPPPGLLPQIPKIPPKQASKLNIAAGYRIQ